MSEKVPSLDEARKWLRQDQPHRALDIQNRYIAANPNDSHAYFSRHQTWMDLGEYRKALDDCNRAMALRPHIATYRCRGEVYRALGDYESALKDFNRERDLDFQDWLTAFGPHVRADTLARLGRLDEALADCDLIEDDHWMPAHCGLPGGDKQQFIAEIKRRAEAARGGRR